MLDLYKFQNKDLEDAVAVTCLVAIKRLATEYLEEGDGRNPGRVLGIIKENIQLYEDSLIKENGA